MFENFDSRLKILLSLTAAVGVKYAVGWWMREKRQDRFELVGTVKELICYPVKSCKGIYIQEAEITKFGLKVDGVTDRHWMVTRDNGRFLSQRQQPNMALITVSITEKGVEMSAPGTETFTLPKDIPKSKDNVSKCVVWDCTTQGIDCGDGAAKWISDFLGQEGLRIVYYSQDLEKRSFINETKPWFTRTLETDWTGYADWSTYLFLTTASLEALNKHLKKPVTMKSFRPNIVIDGTDPWEEDSWEEIIIGENVQLRCLDASAREQQSQQSKGKNLLCFILGQHCFSYPESNSLSKAKDNWEEVLIGDKAQMRCVSACDRCLLTTVDPEKGEKSPDGEPLATLKRIRSIPPYDKYGECVFGINAAPDVCGFVQVGDPVYAIRKLLD